MKAKDIKVGSTYKYVDPTSNPPNSVLLFKVTEILNVPLKSNIRIKADWIYLDDSGMNGTNETGFFSFDDEVECLD